MRSNYVKITTLQKTIIILSITIGLGLMTFISVGSAQAPFYPPFELRIFIIRLHFNLLILAELNKFLYNYLYLIISIFCITIR